MFATIPRPRITLEAITRFALAESRRTLESSHSHSGNHRGYATLCWSTATRTGLAQIWNETLAKRAEQDFAGVMIAVHPHFEFGTGDENSPLHGKASIMEFRKWPYAGWCQSPGWLRASARKTAKICPMVVP